MMALETTESANRNAPHEYMGYMSGPVDYHPLTCAACGKYLSPKTGRNELVCYHCGHYHHFLQPSGAASDADFHEGDSVAVEWDGLWWPARVVAADNEKKSWRIHFSGWAPAFDDVVDAQRIRSIDSMTDIAVPPDIRHDNTVKPEARSTEMHPVVGTVLILLMIIGFAVLTMFSDPLQFPDTFGQMYPPVINIISVDR